ncbi:MAG: arsenate reductase ArsC [Planctomycetota bacterium]
MRILFVCTGNACRSQMAEGLCRALASSELEVYSAGTRPAGVHPRTIASMKERGIDISKQTSNGLRDVPPDCDLVITLCGDAAEACPAFPETTLVTHWPIADPVRATGCDAEIMAAFRTARDEIELRVTRLLEELSMEREEGGGGGLVG